MSKRFEMSWLKKILGSKSNQPATSNDVLKQLDNLATAISNEVDQQLKILATQLESLETNPMMAEKEQASALESVYWAISLLRLIEKSEHGWIPQAWVPQLLNDILNEMESEKRGCRVRFARQMLQEYAEIQAQHPEKSYHSYTMLSYFRLWMWECMKAPNAKQPEQTQLEGFDVVIQPFLNKKDLWN